MVRRVDDEISSTATGEGLTDGCSDGALLDPQSSNNPEPNCVLPLDNKIDFGGLEGLEGLEDDNLMPQVLFSSSPWVTV